MTKTNSDLSELPAQHKQGDRLRSIAEAVLQLIMETDVEGASRQKRSRERQLWRNGYLARGLDVRLDMPNLWVPKLRQGSCFLGAREHGVLASMSFARQAVQD